MKKLFILMVIAIFLSGCGNSNIIEEEVIEKEEEKEVYAPKFEGSARISIEGNGDYKLMFNVNNEGTIYYVVQPWYEVIEYDVTASDIEAKIGQEFTLLSPDGEAEKDPIYVVSAKNIDVKNYDSEIVATGYFGDINGSRPPKDSNVEFGVVVWYVFKDLDGNYSNVQSLIQR